MKKIKFLRGFRGVLTQEQHYKPLVVAEFSDAKASALVAQGVAEYVIPKKKPAARKKVSK